MPKKKLILSQNLEKFTVKELNELVEREEIPKPKKGKGKGGKVLKSDLLRAIIDFRARHAKVKKITIPTPKAKPKATPEKAQLTKMTVPVLRKYCKELGVSECQEKKYLKKNDLVKLILAAQKGIKIPVSKKSIYAGKRIKTLRELCKERNIEAEKCKLDRAELIAVLEEWDRIQSVEPALYKCGTSTKKKCPPNKICDVNFGMCLAKTKIGISKRARESRENKWGKEYYYDEEYGLVGRKADVLAHLKYWDISKKPKKKPKKLRLPIPSITLPPVSPPSPRKLRLPSPPSPPRKPKKPKKLRLPLPSITLPPVSPPSPRKPRRPSPPSPPRKPKKCTDEVDPLICDPNELCSAKSGKCIKDDARVRKNKWILEIDGRVIIGSKKTIKKLQKSLGGGISKAEIPPVEKLATEKIVREVKESLKKLKQKKKPSTPKKISIPPKKVPTPKKITSTIEAAKQDIARTFSECLASLT